MGSGTLWIRDYIAPHWKAIMAGSITFPILTWLAAYAGGFNNPAIGYSIHEVGGVVSLYSLNPSPFLHPFLWLYKQASSGRIISESPAYLEGFARDSAWKHIPWHWSLSVGFWLLSSKVLEIYRRRKQMS